MHVAMHKHMRMRMHAQATDDADGAAQDWCGDVGMRGDATSLALVLGAQAGTCRETWRRASAASLMAKRVSMS